MSKKACVEKCQPTFERLYQTRTRVTLAGAKLQGRGSTPWCSPLSLLLGWDRGRSEAGLLQEQQSVEVTCQCQAREVSWLENQLEAVRG